MTPSQLDRPAYLMNVPFSFPAGIATIGWTEELPDQDRKVDRRKAMHQFFELYHFLSARALVTILPTPPNRNLQHLVYTATLGFVPEHLDHRRVVVLSQCTSPARRGEAAVGKRFFEEMGYEVHDCPFPFEGEAELKYLYGNIYVGGFGQCSSRMAYDWMESTFGMKIIKVEERDSCWNHLDCSIFPVNGEQTLVATYLFNQAELREIEAVTEIIPVDKHFVMRGGCSSVILHQHWLSGTIIDDVPHSHVHYHSEKEKNLALERLACRMGKILQLFDFSEYQKGGACLSCVIMHLNRFGYVDRPSITAVSRGGSVSSGNHCQPQIEPIAADGLLPRLRRSFPPDVLPCGRIPSIPLKRTPRGHCPGGHKPAVDGTFARISELPNHHRQPRHQQQKAS